MEPDPVSSTITSSTARSGPSGSSTARRGSASAASRAKTGVPAVRPPSPIRTADVKPAAAAALAAPPVDPPVATRPVEEWPVEVALVEPASVEASPMEAAPMEAAPAEARLVEARPVEVALVEPAPAEAPPVEAALVEAATMEAALVEASRVEAAAMEAAIVEASRVQEDVLLEAPVREAPVRKAPVRVAPVRTGPIRATPVRPAAPASPAARPVSVDVALSVIDLSKSFGSTKAADAIELEVHAGSLYGMVGPNGAGKTTTLSMISGLLRPDSGVVRVYGADVWANPAVAKKSLGVLPDRLRLFDRLTGAEFLHHAGALHGLDRTTVAHRSADLAAAFGLQNSMHRLVSDFSVGLTKKIAIAAAMIHSPRLLVLDEPFESVDPVSVAMVIDILKRFTSSGGTVLLSSHSMELIEHVCDSVAIIAEGRVLTAGSLEDVTRGSSLEARFVELAGGTSDVEGMEWLQSFSN